MYGEVMANFNQREALARLIAERRESYSNLSRLIGRNPAYIHQFITRKTPKRLSDGDRRTLANYLRVPDSSLGGPVEISARQPDNMVFVPRYEVEASAGFGALDFSERYAAHIGFDGRFLRELCEGGVEDLSIIRVKGDSMFPTLTDGDDIMVDRSPVGVRLNDGVYVLRRDDTLVVKRVAIHPATLRVTVSSDNSAYPSWPDCDPMELDVLGRVVWSGRRMT
ncbi:S24 family peptidase [Erythrobacter donghaensis]|jgi:phage repressor protein C with HTH and peptisase S24 domain|uniref:S24 family peptidase n=1 Tax=Erythrobacter donghaensis TaxID=267135 RepID=UPI000AF3638B|nr:S24 family peptidase [Erythrobacter donghaensis]